MFLRRHIACIHDLHTWIMPESYGRMFRWAHRVVLPRLGCNAAYVTTVSELSSRHLVHYGVVRPEKLVVTYNGSDHAKQWKPDRSSLAVGRRPFVLYLGRPQRYKNAELIWRIAPRLHEMGLDVYVAGAVNANMVACGSLESNNVRFLGRISDDDLAKVYSKALCFLFPSRIEGFGIPAVEAMMFDCPVVASSAPCLPEICGSAALYAAPDDAEGWVRQVGRLQLDADLRAKPRCRGALARG